MNGMQLVFDKKAWKDLVSFIMEGPIETSLEAQSHKLLEKAQEKKVDDIKDYYHINAKVEFVVYLLSTVI